jgi:hypothetical protein
MDTTKKKMAFFFVTLMVISSIIIIPTQFVRGDSISFTCTAKLSTDNAGIDQIAHYTLIINNTGSAKLGYANFTIPAGYSNLISSSIKVTNNAGQLWTATIATPPSHTVNGTVMLQGSGEGLSTNQIVTATFTITNPLTVNVYQWIVNANQNTGQGGHDYQVYTIFFNQLITPAIETELSCYPNASITAGNTIHDSAKLTGTTPDATGVITYTLYMGTYPLGAEIYHTQVTVTPSNLPTVPNSDESPILTQAGQYYYLVTYNGDSKNYPAKGTPENFIVTAADLNKFTFENIPSQTVGNPFIIKITAQDQYENTLTNYYASNTLLSSAGALTPTTANFSNGMCSEPVTISTIATGVVLTTSDASINGASNQFEVKPSPPYKLVYTVGSNQTLNAGKISSTITVQYRDSGNNPVTVGTPLTINLTTTSSVGIFYKESATSTQIASINIPAGSNSANFYYVDTKAGNPTITASSANTQSAITQFTINPANTGATKYILSAPESTVAGSGFQITVTACDNFRNKISNYEGTVTFTSSDNQSTLASDSTLTNGFGIFPATLRKAGQQTITATDKANNAIIGSASINVIANAALPNQMEINPQTAIITAHQSQTYTAALFDIYGNKISDVTSKVSWSINSGAGTYLWTANSVQVDKAGSWQVNASYTGLLDSTAFLTVTGHTGPTAITIAPKSASIEAPTAIAYNATASDGINVWDVTTQVIWSIDVSAGGFWNQTIYTSANAGTWNVTATLDSISNIALLTVTNLIPTPTPSPTITPTPTPIVSPNPTSSTTPTSNPTTTSTKTTSTSTTTKTSSTYAITFQQQGLPSETSWNVTFNGVTKSAKTATIIFTGIKAGTYQWTASSIIGENESTRYVASGAAAGAIEVYSASVQKIHYNVQYYLTVESKYGNSTGEGWYDANTSAQFAITSSTTQDSGTQYSFSGWTGTGTGSYSGRNGYPIITMVGPITETANWEQASSLYSVLLIAVIILIMMLLATILAWKRRKKKQKDD